ncbi:ATP-dependent zinc metalloprotease FtsH [uncultured Parvimonas sp.]|uniref:ATP-dependent zinc metalloprotease FtsH n=1 Tax=uncultured Parvimonas sp. TaxID=747372 RepID=UPI00288B118E|nr:ATP-dependent zinc metalloprotease FtsH [uncultured Parvimonas sp.]
MNKKTKAYLIYLIPVLFLAVYFFAIKTSAPVVKEYTVTEIVSKIKNDEVAEVTTQGAYITGKLNDKDKTEFKTYLPQEFRFKFYDNYLKAKVDNNTLKYNGKAEPTKPFYLEILPTLIILIGLGVLWFMFMRQAQGGGKVMNFGKSKARLHKDKKNEVTFGDVAGLEEEKEELQEIVDFLKSPKKYSDIGARIPKGVLMVGPPGTGKTYLSRAVAGEAKVPFFSISGSDFVEMFVGVGASRVRDLFEEAKKNAPCIIFIDEIDAVGRRRGAGLGGGHDEREQTLNQLLVEMDGFGVNEGIIVMAATNRPDILDPAILRPGRFDRQIYVGIPNVREREAILMVHTRNKRLAPDVDLKVIAKHTTGFTPADLENLCNEAALLSARYGQKTITMKVFEEASIKVVAGPEKKSAVVTDRDRKITAYHEAGHAIVSRFVPLSDPVQMITIVPRGRAGGFTAYTHDEDSQYMTVNGMKSRLAMMLGGRSAELIIFEDFTTGASNDIERATKLARNMVTTYGMSSKIGPINYDMGEEETFLGRDFGKGRTYSEDIAKLIDGEVKDLLDEAYATAQRVLNENIEFLHAVAKKLLEEETVSGKDFEDMYKKHMGIEEKFEVTEEVKTEEVNLETEEVNSEVVEETVEKVEIEENKEN